MGRNALRFRRVVSGLMVFVLSVMAAGGSFVVGAFPDGSVVTDLQAGVGWDVGGDVGLQEEAEDRDGCGGEAPSRYWCSRGGHDGGPVSMSCEAGAGYTGAVESVIAWTGGERWLVCLFDDGQLMSVEHGGPFPPVGVEYRMECWSYHPGSEGLLLRPNGLGPVFTLGPLQGPGEAVTDPQGLPGGSGLWGCGQTG